jgi:inhibitor of cysteine peptidase
MRLAKLLLPGLALALALPAFALEGAKDEDKPVVVTDKDAGGKVALKKGGTLQVKLPFQGGTGYTWGVARNDDKVLKAKGKPTTEPVKKGDKPRPGGAQLQVFAFTAESAGASKLELEYERPFEKGKAPAKTFALTVTVK